MNERKKANCITYAKKKMKEEQEYKKNSKKLLEWISSSWKMNGHTFYNKRYALTEHKKKMDKEWVCFSWIWGMREEKLKQRIKCSSLFFLSFRINWNDLLERCRETLDRKWKVRVSTMYAMHSSLFSRLKHVHFGFDYCRRHAMTNTYSWTCSEW